MYSKCILILVIYGLSMSARAGDPVKGKTLYNGAGGCFACHQITGKGIPNVIPPLEKSVWVTGNPERLIAIALKGVQGPMLVNGKHYNASMPPQSLFDDIQMADISTYIRSSFGNQAPAVTEEMVKNVRNNLAEGNSVEDILKQYPFKGEAAKLNGISNKKIDDAEISQEKPTVVRTFMPGASPATLAVALPEGQYYCWDAGECRLRYVWSQGGFITNNKKHWSSNGKPVASFKGKVYYRAKESLISLDEINSKNTTNHKKPIYDTTEAVDFPVIIGEKRIGMPKYKGYRLIDHHPQFWYKSDGCDIFELIKSTEDKQGIIRYFKILSKGQQVKLKLNPQSTATISIDKGSLENGLLILTSEEAADFKVTIREVKK